MVRCLAGPLVGWSAGPLVGWLVRRSVGSEFTFWRFPDYSSTTAPALLHPSLSAHRSGCPQGEIQLQKNFFERLELISPGIIHCSYERK